MDKLRKDSILLMIYSMFTNVVNYAFQIICGRVMSIADFGLLNTLLSLIMILSVPSSPLSTVASRHTAECCARKTENAIPPFIQQLHVYVSIFSLLFILLWMPFSKFIADAVRISDRGLLFMALIISIASYYQAIASSLLHGMQKFFLMSCIPFVVAIFKVFGAAFSGQLMAILVLLLLGTMISTIMVYFILKKDGIDILSCKISAINMKRRLFSISLMWKSFIINLCLMFMMNIDMLLVRGLYSEETSGLYGSSMLFGRILTFGTAALVTAVYPSIISAHAQLQRTAGLYLRSLAYCLIVTIAFFIPLILFPKLIVTLLFGQKYLTAIPYMVYSCFLAATIILNRLNSSYCIAIDNTKLLVPTFIAGCIFCASLGLRFHDRVESLLLYLSAVMTAMYLINLIYILILDHRFKKGEFADGKASQKAS